MFDCHVLSLAEKQTLAITSNLNLTKSQRDAAYELHVGYSSDLTVELTCSFTDRSRSVVSGHSSLDWWEGDTLITNETSSREIIKSNNCGVTLRIHNISVFDYGRYQCKCGVGNYYNGIQFNLEQWYQSELKESCEHLQYPIVNILPLGKDTRKYKFSNPVNYVDFINFAKGVRQLYMYIKFNYDNLLQ